MRQTRTLATVASGEGWGSIITLSYDFGAGREEGYDIIGGREEGKRAVMRADGQRRHEDGDRRAILEGGSHSLP